MEQHNYDVKPQKYKRRFKGVWIPKWIYENEELSLREKFLLVEIDSLSEDTGWCYASNARLGEFLGCSKSTVANLISGLSRRGVVTVKVKYKEGTKQIEKRFVKLIVPIPENGNTPYRNQEEAIIQNGNTPIPEIGKDNNTYSFNNTINNTENIKHMSDSNESDEPQIQDPIEIEFDEIWKSYPNKKSGRKKAFSSYKTARKKTSEEQIIKGLQGLLKSQKDWSYLPHLTTWLNGERWEVDYGEPQQTNPDAPSKQVSVTDILNM